MGGDVSVLVGGEIVQCLDRDFCLFLVACIFCHFFGSEYKANTKFVFEVCVGAP